MGKRTVFMVVIVIALAVLFAPSNLEKGDSPETGSPVTSSNTRKEDSSQSPVNNNIEETGTGEEYVSPIDFNSLWKINPDVVGWLTIEDTRINDPILQGEDNEEYFRTEMDGTRSVAASIYMDFACDPEMNDSHTIIYGHNMRNGSRFAPIVKYKNPDYFREHQKITIFLPDREIHLRPVAAVLADGNGIRRKTEFHGEEDLNRYLEEMTEECSYRKLPKEPIDHIYSFLTCSYEYEDARTILYAVEEK